MLSDKTKAITSKLDKTIQWKEKRPKEGTFRDTT